MTAFGTLAPMRAVMLEVPEFLLAERRRLGHDRLDEMWEGVLHMVPPPRSGHYDMATELIITLSFIVRPLGLDVRQDGGLFDPAVRDYSSYRQPDVMVFGADVRSERGIEGAAHLAIEIRSPNDESFEKLPFYERVGVQEVLIIDPATASIRHWSNGPGGLVESVPEADGRIMSAALPVAFRIKAGALRIEHDGVTTDVAFST